MHGVPPPGGLAQVEAAQLMVEDAGVSDPDFRRASRQRLRDGERGGLVVLVDRDCGFL